METDLKKFYKTTRPNRHLKTLNSTGLHIIFKYVELLTDYKFGHKTNHSKFKIVIIQKTFLHEIKVEINNRNIGGNSQI